MEPSGTLAQNSEGYGPIPLQKQGLPSSALLHVRPETMPAPTRAVASATLPPPAPSPSFSPEPVTPRSEPLPPPSFQPAQALPIIAPSVFETTPDLLREQKKIHVGKLLVFAGIVVLVLIIGLYFWGAYLVNANAV